MRKNLLRVMLTLATIAIASATIISNSGPNLTAACNQGIGNLLTGTSWKLVLLKDGDDQISKPDDGSKYTLTFGGNGRVSSRVDCNRGGSTWSARGTNELQFGSWSMSRAKCGPGSLHDKIVTEGANVRYYEIKNGHLFLWGMTAGGYYELEPLTSQKRGH